MKPTVVGSPYMRHADGLYGWADGEASIQPGTRGHIPWRGEEGDFSELRCGGTIRATENISVIVRFGVAVAPGLNSFYGRHPLHPM